MSEQAKRDQNFVTSMLFVGSDGGTYNAQGDKTTGRLYVDSAAGSGTVTDVSVVTANGFAGTVADSTTTPAITLETTVTGILKGNGTAISAGTAGDVDSILPTQTGNSGKYLTTDGTNSSWASVAGGGITIGTTTITSGTNTRILYDNSGVVGEYSVIPVALGGTNATSASITAFNNITGYTASGATGTTSTNLVFSTSPVLTTPNIGAATATSVNGLTITSSTGTFTLTNAKTLAVTNSLTLSGTDSTTMTFPTTTATIARTDAGQTFTGVQNFTSPDTTTSITTSTTSFTAWAGATTLLTIGGTGASASLFAPSTLDATSSTTGAIRTSGGISAAKAANIGTILTVPQIINTPLAATVSSNAATITRASRVNNFTNSSAATMAITLSTTGALDGDMLIVRVYDFSAVAQTIGWTNTEDSTVTAPTTSNGSTTLPLTVGFQYNSGSSKWRTIAKA